MDSEVTGVIRVASASGLDDPQRDRESEEIRSDPRRDVNP
jgi:hypothetical protein